MKDRLIETSLRTSLNVETVIAHVVSNPVNVLSTVQGSKLRDQLAYGGVHAARIM